MIANENRDEYRQLFSAVFADFYEWAADQDPHLKEVFYTRLLPELKARDKAVLVITHDEGYFHLADRMLKLDYGKLVTAEVPEAGGPFITTRTVAAVTDGFPTFAPALGLPSSRRVLD